MAQRRIFAKKRPRRGRIAVAATVLVVLGSAAVAVLLPGATSFPDCSDASIRADLLALLRADAGFDGTADLRLGGVNERKRTFREGELFARDCAATAWFDGTEEYVRFRIGRDDATGDFVTTLRGV